MNTLRQISSYLLGTLLVIISFGSAAAQKPAVIAQDPYQMIQQVAQSTFARIHHDSAAISANPNHLKQIVEQELMPYIDHSFASRWILYKVNANAAEKKAFSAAFKNYLITTYATIFAKYDNQPVEFAKPQPFNGKKVVEVKTTVKNQGGDDLAIDFRVRFNKKTGQWKAFDLKAQGISLLDSKRSELMAILRQNDGVAKATKLLVEKAKADIIIGA